MSTKASENYTAEDTERVVRMYMAKDPIENIAEIVGKSKRSVIAKLVQLGLYEAQKDDKPKRKTKADLIVQLADLTNISPDDYEGLDKAPYPVIERLVAQFRVKQDTIDTASVLLDNR